VRIAPLHTLVCRLCAMASCFSNHQRLSRLMSARGDRHVGNSGRSPPPWTIGLQHRPGASFSDVILPFPAACRYGSATLVNRAGVWEGHWTFVTTVRPRWTGGRKVGSLWNVGDRRELKNAAVNRIGIKHFRYETCWLPGMDSNHDSRLQRPLSYR
jgi:hypothetical protein